jgi:hypothetical protein
VLSWIVLVVIVVITYGFVLPFVRSQYKAGFFVTCSLLLGISVYYGFRATISDPRD